MKRRKTAYRLVLTTSAGLIVSYVYSGSSPETLEKSVRTVYRGANVRLEPVPEMTEEEVKERNARLIDGR